ncbi:NERD domain-containing protein [Sporosarcina sp. Marseille-Q4063]|uniref:nuclease-related domain-containing protein n=1 Tax=Sporosarcina sp. Marseille-Q4063 TaxID=2810514 RepID=UPI001BAE8065|nr:nuclease-related domain-containing protein [Sporosarcina sp. Marseille-Q4063]QUW20413.1 NERD domain-containing protein [Sporosarcina sp. Marseille-Q4063]
MNKFIVKKRVEPLIIESLRAALSRLDPTHEKYAMLNGMYSSRISGLAGEDKVDQVFQKYKFSMQHKIFNGLSLTSSTDFQIDSLFITPAYAVVIETKNLAGSIKVKNNPPQLLQTLDNGDIRSYVSPVLQVQSNKELLQDWFHSRNISLPIYGIVALAFPKKDVELFDTDIQFLYPSGIPSYIRSLPTTPHLLDEKNFSLLINDLFHSDKEFIPNPLCLTYSLQKNDIFTGVFCPACRFLSMTKYRGGWRCPACAHKSSQAHVQAIRDWFLLFGGKMTNKDCREFLNIHQRSTATRILQSMDLHTAGEKRNRTYAISTFR